MVVILVSTVRFVKNSDKTHKREYIVEQTLEKKCKVSIVDIIVDHPGTLESCKVIQENKEYESCEEWCSVFEYEMKNKRENYTYCEIEIRSYDFKRRDDREFKINLEDKKSKLENFAEVGTYLEMFFDVNERLNVMESGQELISIKINEKEILEVNTAHINEEMDAMRTKLMKEIKEQTSNIKDDVVSVIQDVMSDNLSSVSSSSKKKKKKRSILNPFGL